MKKLFAKIIGAVFGKARPAFPARAKPVESVRIFEESPGVWKFQSGAQIWARYDSYEHARKVAEEYNFIKVEK